MRKNLFCKIFSLLLALLMMVSVVGCGDSNNESTESNNFAGDDFFTDDVEVNINTDNSQGQDTGSVTSNDPSSSGTSSNVTITSEGKSWKEVLEGMPSSLRGTTVSIYNWNPVSEYSGTSAVISEFEKETGIKVKWITQTYSTYLSNLASRVAADDSPDLVRTHTPNPLALISLQPISVSGYDFSDKAWDQQTMKDYTYGGKVYATSLKNTHLGSASIIMYNKALINKYDLEDPYILWKKGKWTFDKMIEISKDYLKSSKAAFAIGGTDFSGWLNLWGVQGPVKYENGKFVNNTGDKAFLDGMQKIAQYRHTDKIYQGWGVDQFDNGECLFWMNGSIYARKNNARFQTLKTAGQMNTVPIPTISGQEKQYQPMSEYEAYGIADGAKNPKAAPYFLRKFLDAENYDLNSVFCSSQAVEVYNYVMSQENRIWELGCGSDENYYGGKADAFSEGYSKQTKDQIITFVNSNSADIDARAEKLNSAISKLD